MNTAQQIDPGGGRMNTKAYDRTLQAWAEEWSKENIDDATHKLIALATWDLHTGAVDADADGHENEWSGYPGFSTACDRIQEALRALPSTIWLDTDAEYWTESEPYPYEDCPDCNGAGTKPSDTIDEPDVECDYCNGDKRVEAYLCGWYQVERKELKRAIVGKHLSEYV